MTYHLTIPDFTPPSLNTLFGHWASRKRIKRDVREIIGFYARLAQIPVAEGPRKISLVLILPKKARRPDADNLWKALADAEERALVPAPGAGDPRSRRFHLGLLGPALGDGSAD